MSRGPGKWQRMILNVINDGSPCIVVPPFFTESQKVAARRAARTLEKAGKVKLTTQTIDGANRLVAYGLDMSMPEPRMIRGIDGKVYRQPI